VLGVILILNFVSIHTRVLKSWHCGKCNEALQFKKDLILLVDKWHSTK
jgi:hypothetical protein